jgi:hypothetical protein
MSSFLGRNEFVAPYFEVIITQRILSVNPLFSNFQIHELCAGPFHPRITVRCLGKETVRWYTIPKPNATVSELSFLDNASICWERKRYERYRYESSQCRPLLRAE